MGTSLSTRSDTATVRSMDVTYEAHITDMKMKVGRTAEGRNVFETDVNWEKLWAAYIASFPMRDGIRSEHKCNACKDFIRRYGNLVIVDDDNEVVPLMWDTTTTMKPIYRTMHRALAKLVGAGRITRPFLTDERILGDPVTNGWRHMHVATPTRAFLEKAPHGRANELAEGHGVILRAMSDWQLSTFRAAIELLTTGGLNMPHAFIDQARWMFKLAQARINMGSGPISRRRFSNMLWVEVCNAPPAWLHVRGSVLATLFDDIASGKPHNVIKRTFGARTASTVYQRPVAAPAEQTIAKAERLVEELGIASSLQRRFATESDVKEFDVAWLEKWRMASADVGVFSSVRTNMVKPKSHTGIQHITWNRFMRTVLPIALKIQYMPPASRIPIYTVLTAVDRDAPPLFAWDGGVDGTGARCPLSWYTYPNGVPPSQFGIAIGIPKDVAYILRMPNMLVNERPQYGDGYILVLCGVKDSGSPGMGLFPQVMRPELHEVKSVIERYSLLNQPQRTHRDHVAGPAIRPDMGPGSSIHVRVELPDSIGEYVIDRWD